MQAEMRILKSSHGGRLENGRFKKEDGSATLKRAGSAGITGILHYVQDDTSNQKQSKSKAKQIKNKANQKQANQKQGKSKAKQIKNKAEAKTKAKVGSSILRIKQVQ